MARQEFRFIAQAERDIELATRMGFDDAAHLYGEDSTVALT